MKNIISSTRTNCAMIVTKFILISSIPLIMTAPVGNNHPGPDLNQIEYLHNLTLRLQDGSLNGLEAIDGFSDVDSTMSQSLKDAINRAMPNYLFTLNSTHSSSQNSSKNSTINNNSTSSIPTATGEPLNLINRKKRSDSSINSTNLLNEPNIIDSIQKDASVISTTQPYGTDEEFYARTDLVHFHVDIELPEGSGFGFNP